jgi:hypothetical protein
MAESYIVELLKSRRGDFASGIIGSPFHVVCDRVSALVPSGVKIPQAALLHALKEAGWIDCGRLASADYPNKKHIFAAPDVIEGMTKSEIRRAVEIVQEPKAVLLDIKRKSA